MKLSARAREKRREYMKKWRSRNKDKVREYNRAYWERKALEEKADLDAKKAQ